MSDPVEIIGSPVQNADFSPETVNRAFGGHLRRVRSGKGLSQAELGRMVDLSRVTIANIESGKQNVQLQQVFAFALALDVSPLRLIPDAAEVQLGATRFNRVRSDTLTAEDLEFVEFAKQRLAVMGAMLEKPR